MSTRSPSRGVAPDPVEIREGVAADLPRLEALWRGLYDHQASRGMLVNIPADGFAKWQAGLASAIGRFACVIVAERDGVPVGFAAGRFRPHPAYLGGMSAGYVGEVFVDERVRGQQIGRRILDATIEWFRARDVHRVELNVIPGNTEGLGFYERLGWVEDHRQLVWDSHTGLGSQE